MITDKQAGYLISIHIMPSYRREYEQKAVDIACSLGLIEMEMIAEVWPGRAGYGYRITEKGRQALKAWDQDRHSSR